MTLSERLAEAEAALHDLSIGRNVASLTDQNGEAITYTHANRAALQAYIGDLKRQIAGQSAPTVLRFQSSRGT